MGHCRRQPRQHVPFLSLVVTLTDPHSCVALFDWRIASSNSTAAPGGNEDNLINPQETWYDIREKVLGVDMSLVRCDGHGYTEAYNIFCGDDVGGGFDHVL